MVIEKINAIPPVNDRRFDFDKEELTALELIARVAKKINELIDLVNGLDYSKKEDSINITVNRKLSPKGNFTGSIFGRPGNIVLAGIDSNSHKISYLADQFSDGYTGQVIDAGFFMDTMVRKNYDGGVFPRPKQGSNPDQDCCDGGVY